MHTKQTMYLKIENYINKHFKILEPFKDIIWFLFLFLSFEFVWKLCVHQGEDESILLVLGKDLTSYTEGISAWTAKIIYWFVHDLCGYHDLKMTGASLYFNDSLHIDIIWGCTGLKQFFMFSFILLCYFGPRKKKLWFLPMSLLILLAVNILRLSIITIIIRQPFPEWFIGVNEWYNGRIWENTRESYRQFYVDWFNIFHRDIFTWIYYDGVIFVLWLIWEEKINKPYQRLRKSISENSDQQVD